MFPENKMLLIAGPCVIEDNSVFETARRLKEIVAPYASSVHWIFKSSYDKANRSSVHNYRGPGLKLGLQTLAKIKEELDIEILTDVHSPDEAREAAKVCDIIQVPAFLCRQTDLLVTAGETQAIVNIKKGQFLSPWEMQGPIDKVLSTGNNKIILTERGCSFGYNNLVSDMRSIEVLRRFGFPVVFDGTHSVQLPGALHSQSGGQTEFIPVLTRSAIAAGVQGLFIETHPNPASALSDAASMLSLKDLERLLPAWVQLFTYIQEMDAVSV